MTDKIPLPKAELDHIKSKCPCYMVGVGGNVLTITNATSEFFKTEYLWLPIRPNMLLYETKKQAVVHFSTKAEGCTTEQRLYLRENYAEYFI